MSAPRSLPLLVMELDAGEAEVISLARQLAPCMAIIDERRGRRIAQQVYGLPVKGTAGILVEAHRHGLITELRPQLLALRVAGYFIADGVIAAACQAVGEWGVRRPPKNIAVPARPTSAIRQIGFNSFHRATSATSSTPFLRHLG